MPVYVVAQITITDRTRYDAYQAGFPEVFAKYRGELLAVDESPRVVEGEWPYTRTVLIKFPDATVTRVQLINPHSWIYVDVKLPDGKVENWAIEAGSPNILMRRGITKDTVKVGQKIVVEGYQAKDGSRRANGRDLTLPDGQKLFLGSSGEGAPYEVQRPGIDTEKKQ